MARERAPGSPATDSLRVLIVGIAVAGEIVRRARVEWELGA